MKIKKAVSSLKIIAGWRWIFMLLVCAGFSPVASAQTLCVFDVAGQAGPVMQLMKNYALSARKWGAQLDFISFRDELKAVHAFDVGQCDGVIATGFATRQYNQYIGSLSAVGAIPSNALAKTILGLLGSRKLAADMQQNGYEVSGVFPGGLAYLLVKDRRINSLKDIQGKRMGVLEIDPPQQWMATQVGAKPVFMTTANAGVLFQQHAIDIVPLPLMAFEPLDVYRTMGNTGGVIHFPIAFLTMTSIIKPEKFPKGFAANSRRWFAKESQELMDELVSKENAIPQSLWLELSSAEKVSYLRLMREMRIKFIENGIFDAKMMSLLKRLRCQQNPRSFECPLHGE